MADLKNAVGYLLFLCLLYEKDISSDGNDFMFANRDVISKNVIVHGIVAT